MDPIKIAPKVPEDGNRSFSTQLGITDEQGEALIERFQLDHNSCTCAAELAPKLQTYTVDELVVLVLQFM